MLVKNSELFDKISLISNKMRFRILELTQNKELTITELSSVLNLAYTKCSDYVSMLEKANLVEKSKEGKEVRVRAKVVISGDRVKF